MRFPIFHRLPLRGLLPTWVAGLALALSMTSMASAAPAAAKAPRGGKKAPPAALTPPEMDRNSSRFILPENQTAYLEKIRSRLSMTKRIADPFGRSQDPDAAPVVVATNNDKNNVKDLRKKVTLEQALANFKINTIIPGEGRFLANGRSYKKGQTIPFKSRGKVLSVQVMTVDAAEIIFRNAETGEIATLKMKLLPNGMQPGTKLTEAPGLSRTGQDDPINLDVPHQP